MHCSRVERMVRAIVDTALVWGGASMAHGEAKGRIEFLRNSLRRQTESFSKKREKNRQSAFWAKMFASCFGAATTIMIGLQNNELFEGYEHTSALLSAAALVTSAGVTLLSVWDGFFDHRWLWIQYTSTLGQLYAISDELDFLTADDMEIASDKLEGLYRRFEAVLQDTDNSWAQKRTKDDRTEAPAPASN